MESCLSLLLDQPYPVIVSFCKILPLGPQRIAVAVNARKNKYTCFDQTIDLYPASILRKSTSGRHRPVSYPDGPMTARYRFT